MTDDRHIFPDLGRVIRRLDLPFMVLTAVLLITGILFIYGTGQEIGGRFVGYWGRQLLWMTLGIIAFIATVLIDYRVLGRWAWLLYLAGLALLVLVLVAGTEINDARSWITIPGGTLQPAELAKPATLIFLAWLASRPASRLGRLLHLGVFALAAATPAMLIAKQPDWGTGLVFVPLALSIAFVSGMAWRHVIIGVAIVLLTVPVAYRLLLVEHQRERIQTFLRPSEDISNAGWNAHQSLLAVGSGGVWGKGYKRGTQHVLGYLPKTVAPTDFIFSVIGEETGFVGAGAMVCAFLGILICCLRTAALATDRLGAFICVGVATLLFTHIYINIGMTIRAAPIIGIPLPLVSYGGSFLLGTMICLGLVQNVHIRRGEEEA